MLSPLPDSSALEAGIIEDAPPSRLSQVQDNVRNLLRSSMLGSVRSSLRTASTIASPQQPARSSTAWPLPHPGVLPSPTESVATTVSTDSSATTASTTSQSSTTVLLPPTTYDQTVRHMAHQSALFNTRAIAALNHADLEEGTRTRSTQSSIKRKQRHAWKRSKRQELHYSIAASQCLLAVIVGLALAGMLATYIALAVTSTQAPPVFHILFILGILLIGIAFIHTVARMIFLPTHRHKHVKSRRRHRRQLRVTTIRAMPNGEHFSPITAIPVLEGVNEVRLDPDEAQPSTAVHQPPEVWDKYSAQSVTNPPPAYGRWRGSVRADPELLHWQPVSPLNEEVIDIPSPTYEESTQDGSAGSPPSYKTKESPARTRGGNGPQSTPEMVEGRGIGISR